MDFVDHFTSLSYTKDLFRRVLKGGGPAKEVKIPVCWLHIWPGIVLVMLTCLGLYLGGSSQLWWLPIVFWLPHKVIDNYQLNPPGAPYYPFWYPFNKKMWNRTWGYPVKPPAEFIIGSLLYMIIVLIFAWKIMVK